MVPPGRSFPSCSARRMIPMAARSFRLPPGLRYSSFAKTSPDPDGTRRLSCSMGVSPTSWVMSSATRRRDISEVFRLTLQGTGEDGNRQSGGKGGNTYLEWLLRTDERSKTPPCPPQTEGQAWGTLKVRGRNRANGSAVYCSAKRNEDSSVYN